jgi:WD40-like Beta Propeller Repeat
MNPVQRKSALVVAALTMVTSAGVGLGGVAAAGTQLGWDVASPVTAVNDPVAADGCPIEAPNGKALYFASVRGPGGDNDIWMARRPSLDASFGAPVQLPAPINSDAQDFCPTPLRHGGLLFVSTRGGTDAYGTASCGLGDIYLTHRNWRDGTWAEPRNLGCAPNGPNGVGMEYGPSLFSTKAGTFLYFSSGDPVGAGTQDIYVSKRGYDGRFRAPTAVTELNVAGYDDFMPNVSRDGREIVFASSRPGGLGASDIYTATRGWAGAKWCAPANLGPSVNTAAGESRPSLSGDGERLYFGRNGDIYVSQRAGA